ncbi:hypothetical protein BU25DRAFT_485828 [Macroventuria anomochaeta]|uniref:Uncharacterized protein n=1 Tax=Macroventuria anomochaeta TaxID=301207 RepID=A0ACB6S684_9PLEO|nr:uncharacterized protein BU25DRAFT_485828 [Macroventuria anomochaeta]KAF2629780.1 hypothetical protein BU25DRAFT_485828 [Macroventuria anomochaeta]
MAPTIKSLFLDMLPPELRLRIYDYLLVADKPLKGVIARRNTRYGLDTKILRVNKQIYAEARNAFFGKNTFYVTTLPSQSDDDVEGSGAFEPPLQVKDLPLLQHLEIDPLYYPKKLRTEPSVGGWKPICPAAERYIMNLTHLLTFVKSTLLSLSFKADTRSYASFSDEVFGALSSDDESLDDSLDVKKVLTAFHIIEGNLRFTKAVSELVAVRSVSVGFSFPESDFKFKVEKQELCKRGLLFLACQTVFARTEIKIKAMLERLSDDGLDEAEEAEAHEGAATSDITLGGQRRELVGVVQEARHVVEMMK